MKATFVIALYRCEVAGEKTDSIDVQVRYFADWSQDFELFLRSKPVTTYENAQGETVRWPFVRLLAVEEVENPAHGQEVAGFIVSADDLGSWLRETGTKNGPGV